MFNSWDVVSGMIFLYLYVKRQLKNCLQDPYSTIKLLSINHRHTDSHCSIFLCTFLFSSLLHISYFIYFYFFSFILK